MPSPLLRPWFRFAILLANALGFVAPVALAQPTIQRPKLVVVLVVDQFRADYLLRYEKRFLPARGKNGEVGGYEYLMSQGAYYPMAEYGILQSMTCPGHATILTGSYPYQNGIPLNSWWNTEQGHYVYCAEDAAFATVGAPPREHVGVAPTLLNATTVGDELKNAGWGSRVISLALKDRAAIMMGGHRADLSFWMDSHERAWVSSQFYLPDGKLPDWLSELNREITPKKGEKTTWTAEGVGSGTSDESFHPSNDTAHIGTHFPHEVASDDKAVLAFPYGLELTGQAAERAFDAYHLGRGAAPDLLSVSFSSHDYIGHAFGPNSREIEEMTVVEDRVLARLFNHIRHSMPGGLSDVVIVLTGDHGTPPDPEWARAHRMDGGTINEKTLEEAIQKQLDARFGESSGADEKRWLSFDHDFNLFLNRKAVAASKKDLATVIAAVKSILLATPGVSRVFTIEDHEQGHYPAGQPGEFAQHTYFAGRSGDLVLIPKPFWMVDAGDSVTHMTGYNYDRMVPLAMAGWGLKPGVHPEHARVIDLAPTLSYLLGVLPPDLSEGRVLNEALTPPADSRSGDRH